MLGMVSPNGRWGRILALDGLLRLACAIGLLLAPGVVSLGLAKDEGITATVCHAGCDYLTVQAAVIGVESGDTIRILDSVHTEDGIVVGKSVTIEGLQGSGSVIQAASAPGIAGNRVLRVNSGVEVMLKDLTIRYGRVFGHGVRGGGILNQGRLTLDGVTVRENQAVGPTGDPGGTASGGGIWNGGALAAVGSQVSFNEVSGGNGGYTLEDGGSAYGGGLLNEGVLTLDRTTVADNLVTGGDGYQAGQAWGGGLWNSGWLTVSNSTVEGNAVLGGRAWGLKVGQGLGGGMGTSDEGAARVVNSTFSGNLSKSGDSG